MHTPLRPEPRHHSSPAEGHFVRRTPSPHVVPCLDEVSPRTAQSEASEGARGMSQEVPNPVLSLRPVLLRDEVALPPLTAPLHMLLCAYASQPQVLR